MIGVSTGKYDQFKKHVYQGRFIVTYMKHSTCGGYREVLALVEFCKHELYGRKAYTVQDCKSTIKILKDRQARWFNTTEHMIDLNVKYGNGEPLDTKQLFVALVKEGFVKFTVANQFGNSS